MFPQFMPLTKKVADMPALCNWSSTLAVRKMGPSSKVSATVPGTVQLEIQLPTGSPEEGGSGFPPPSGGQVHSWGTGAEKTREERSERVVSSGICERCFMTGGNVN